MSTTNDTGSATPKSVTGEPTSSVVDTVFDATLAWVDACLGRVRKSLSNSARAMLRTARALDVVRERLRA
ncbi:MAG TPA: hypothetical protein VM580_13205 [Labilithrix sp.]|nr:hypothetical protein [Labilithrix sp.]